jgi:hypothetical protein
MGTEEMVVVWCSGREGGVSRCVMAGLGSWCSGRESGVCGCVMGGLGLWEVQTRQAYTCGNRTDS